MGREKASKSSEGRPARDRVVGNSGYAPVKWVNPYTNEDDVQWLEDHADTQHIIICEFLAALIPGYNLSNKYDYKSERYIAAIVCVDTGDGNAGFAVSARGATPIDALYALAYICTIKLEWVFSEGATGTTARWF